MNRGVLDSSHCSSGENCDCNNLDSEEPNYGASHCDDSEKSCKTMRMGVDSRGVRQESNDIRFRYVAAHGPTFQGCLLELDRSPRFL